MLDEFRRANDFTWDRANGIVFDDVIVNQGDANGRKMRVQVVNRGAVENLTGASLNLAWKATNGKGLDSFKAINASQGIFEISFTKGMLANVGRINASLQLILPSGGGIVEGRPFVISNQASLVDQDSAQSTDSWTALEEALANIGGGGGGPVDFSAIEQRITQTEESLTTQIQQTEQDLTTMVEQSEQDLTAQLQQIEQELSSQLVQTAEEVNRKRELEDLSPTVLAAIEGGEGTTFNLLSIPQDGSVTKIKTTFLEDELAEDLKRNIMPTTLSPIGDFYDPENGNFANGVYTQNFKNTGKIYLTEKGEIESYGNNSLVFFDASDTFISSTQHGSDVALPVKRRISPPENASYFIANVPKPYWWDSDDPTYPNLTASLSFIPEKTTMPILRVTEENFQKVVNPNFKPIEISDKFNISADGKVLDIANGIETNLPGRKHSDWQEVEDVEYRTYGVAHVLFKDSDGIFIKTIYSFNNDTALSTWQTWKPPAGSKYVAFNLVTYYYDKYEFFQMGTSKLVNYIPDFIGTESNDEKLIVDFGDSIIAANGFPSDISTVVAHELNANVINMGFGGTRAASHPNTHFNNFSLHKLVDAIVSRNFSAQEASSVVTGIAMPAYFKSKVAQLKTIDFSKVDIVKISYGTNDWNGVVTTEDPLNPLNPTAYKGALRYSVKKLLENYPHLKIILTTPIYRFDQNGSKDSDDWVAGDKKLTDFVDAVFVLGKELKLPVIDCYHDLGINKYNRMQYFYSLDGTHVNYKGRKLLGHKHASGIKNAY